MLQQIKDELLDTRSVAELQLEYETKNVEFQPVFDRAVAAAVNEIGGLTPTAKLIVFYVVAFLTEELREELKKRKPKTLAGRIIRWLFGA